MKIVVVGGHTRNIDKTSVMASLIRELKSLARIALKITQYAHAAWPSILTRGLEQKPVLPVPAPDYRNPDLSRFLRQKLRDLEPPIHLSNPSHLSETKEQPWQH